MGKVIVPEGMLEAACERGIDRDTILAEGYVRRLLTAALEWLQEHPIVPTDEDIEALSKCWSKLSNRDRDMLINWQRRMFRAPEPYVEIESLANRISASGHLTRSECETLAEIIIERRGLAKAQGDYK